MTKHAFYLKGINGLRAMAAMAVVVFHLNMSLTRFHLPNLRSLDLAGFGVTIFFAISGFLITSLLLKEKDAQPIDIKKFYIRRVLRIWPLYFLFLGLSILTAYTYHIGSLPGSLPYYIFLAANIPFILDTALPFLGHYWSLGVEEQFYLFWPWLIKYRHKVLRTVAVFTVIYFLLRLFCRFIEYRWGYSLPYLAIQVTRFDCMSIGALGAVLAHNGRAWFFRFTTHKLTQVAAWAVILLLAFNKFHIASVADQEIVSVVTVCLIMNVSFNKDTLISLEYPVFDFLGKISYGIYVMHQLIIFYFAEVLSHFNISTPVKYPVIYAGVIGLTIGFAYLSYRFFEKPFLTLKHRFSIVRSAASGKEQDG